MKNIKAELRLAIISALSGTDNFVDFCDHLKKENIQVKELSATLLLLPPTTEGQKATWIVSGTLGSEYTKEAIVNKLRENNHWRQLAKGTEQERLEYDRHYIAKIRETDTEEKRLEYYSQLIKKIYSDD